MRREGSSFDYRVTRVAQSLDAPHLIAASRGLRNRADNGAADAAANDR
jgi:hypothetical protein